MILLYLIILSNLFIFIIKNIFFIIYLLFTLKILVPIIFIFLSILDFCCFKDLFSNLTLFLNLLLLEAFFFWGISEEASLDLEAILFLLVFNGKALFTFIDSVFLFFSFLFIWEAFESLFLSLSLSLILWVSFGKS